MPVKMVRRDVQNNGNSGAELDGALELEAGNLEHRPGIRSALVDKTNNRHAVFLHECRKAGTAENLAKQGGCRGLAIGTGNGDDFALEKTRGQFEFADHGTAKFFACTSSGVSRGTPGLTTIRSDAGR